MTTITFEIAIIAVLTIINGVFAMSEVALLLSSVKVVKDGVYITVK